MNTGDCVTRVKELGPGDVVEDKAMTVDEQDDSSVGQQNSALAMLRTGNVSFFSSLYLSLCISVAYVCSSLLPDCHCGLAHCFGICWYYYCMEMV